MAVAYRRQIQGTNSSGSTSAAVNLSTFTAGDLCFVWISRAATTAPSTVPSGWTLLRNPSSTYAGWLYYKILASGDLTTVTWSWAASAKTLAHAASYYGHDATTPIADSNMATATASGTAVTGGSLTSSQKMLALFSMGYSTSSRTYTPPTDYGSERVDAGGTNPDFWHGVHDTNAGWGGGASNPSSTLSGSSTYRFGVHVAIKAAVTTHALAAALTGQGALAGYLYSNDRDCTDAEISASLENYTSGYLYGRMSAAGGYRLYISNNDGYQAQFQKKVGTGNWTTLQNVRYEITPDFRIVGNRLSIGEDGDYVDDTTFEGPGEWFAGQSCVETAFTCLDSVGVTHQLTAALTGSGALSGTVRRSLKVTAGLSGAGTLAGAVRRSVRLAASTSGAGTMAATMRRALRLTSPLQGAGALAGALRRALVLRSDMAGTGTLSGILGRSRALAVSLAGAGALAGPLVVLRRLVSAFDGTGTLSGALSRLRELSASLAGAGTLFGDLVLLTGQIALSVVMSGVGALTGIMTRDARLQADIGGNGQLEARLTLTRRLAAALDGAGTLAGRMWAARPLRAAIQATGDLAGRLSALRPLSAMFQATGTLVGRIGYLIDLQASFQALGTLFGSLTQLLTPPAARPRRAATLAGTSAKDPPGRMLGVHRPQEHAGGSAIEAPGRASGIHRPQEHSGGAERDE